MAGTEYKSTHPKTRKAWRQWLEKNHATQPGVWLIYYKKNTGKRKLSYEEAVEEALCFGWIDSTAYKVDDERSRQKFTPRKRGGVWSQVNKKRVKKLIKDRLMTDAGIAKINEAKKDGSWNKLSSSDHHAANNSLPPALLKAFKNTGNKQALQNFKTFAPSYRKRFLSWIDSAKRPETKEARIKQTVLMAAANKKPDAKGFKL